MASAIETRDLTKRFPKTKSYREIVLRPFAQEETTALQNVSLEVKVGETFALVGPNGAGKTTLIKILSTLVLPTAGEVFVAGRDVKRHPAEVKKRIGCVVAEERSFYWRLTGRQNLNFFAVLNNIPKGAVEKRVAEALSLVGLEEQADKVFRAYSTGMKQRLAIARALLTDPRIVLFDEPTKSLDRPAAEKIRSRIASFAAREPRRTVFFTTHDLAEAEQLATRIAILHQGELKACGTLAELARLVGRKRTYALKLRQPNEEVIERLRRLAPSGQPSERRVEQEAHFSIEVHDEGNISTIIRDLVMCGAQVVECSPVRPSLGEVYDFFMQGAK